MYHRCTRSKRVRKNICKRLSRKRTFQFTRSARTYRYRLRSIMLLSINIVLVDLSLAVRIHVDVICSLFIPSNIVISTMHMYYVFIPWYRIGFTHRYCALSFHKLLTKLYITSRRNYTERFRCHYCLCTEHAVFSRIYAHSIFVHQLWRVHLYHICVFSSINISKIRN